MRAGVRGAIALVAGLAWYGLGADRVIARLDTFREAPRGQRGVQSVVDTDPARLSPETRALVAEALELARREDDWGYVVAGLLTPAERADGLARAADAPPLLAAPGASLEPEMPALVDALLARYGPRTRPPDDIVRREQWPMVDRRTRARALLALLRGPGLDDDRAAVLLHVTLDLLAAQARRADIEAELAALPD